MYSRTRLVIELPAREDADRHQQRGQHDEQHRDAVDAHAVADRVADPVVVLDELEARIGRIERAPERRATARTSRASTISAIQRTMLSTRSSLPGTNSSSSAPTAGRKVMTVRMVVVEVHPKQPPGRDRPGEQRGDADQHGEGIVVEVAGLQLDDARGDVLHPVAEALDDGLVDQPVVEALPQRRADPHRRTDEDEVVELVEVPLVEQELVEARVRRRRAARGVAGRRMYMYQAVTKPMSMATVADHLTQSGTRVRGLEHCSVDDQRALRRSARCARRGRRTGRRTPRPPAPRRPRGRRAAPA